MDEAAQMNTRLGRSAKATGDAVLAQLGLSPSQAVRALWDYLGTHHDVPPFMKGSATCGPDTERQRKIALIRDGAGLAVRVAQEQCDYTGGTASTLDKKTWRELRDDMYDDMLDEMETRCAYPTRTSVC